MWGIQEHYEYMGRHGVVLPPLDCRVPVRTAAPTSSTALRDYISRQPPEYCSLIKDFAASLPPMSSNCRIVVLVPMRHEGRHVRQFLNLFDQQRDLAGCLLDSTSFEVILLLNRFPDEPDDGSSDAARDWSRAAARRWIPHVVPYIHAAGEQSPLTLARKLLADLTIYRSSIRKSSTLPPYLAFEDADLVWNDPFQLALMVRALDAQPDCDIVRGQQDRCPWLMCQFPLLFLMRRSWNFSECYTSRPSLWPRHNANYDFQWNRIVTSGWNTAMRAATYAAIGGYTRERRFEEDMDLGEKVSIWRGEFDGQRFVPHVESIRWIPTRSEGSPRRWIYRLIAGVHPYASGNNYANFFAAEHLRALEMLSSDEFIQNHSASARLDKSSISQTEGLLSEDYQFLIRCTRNRQEADRAYTRILRWLGFGPADIELQGDRLMIHSLDGPGARIDNYAQAWSGVAVPSCHPAKLLPSHSRRTWRLATG